MSIEDDTVDPEYHLKYDTNDMSPEEYAAIKLKPVKIPVTPNINIERMFDDITREALGENIRIGELPYAKQVEVYEAGREAVAQALRTLDDQVLAGLLHKWDFWARDNQKSPPGFWTFWLLLAGRGFGKTRTGAEWVNEEVQAGRAKRIHLVAPTAADVRKVMVEGESGLLAISPPWNRPLFEPSKLQLTWPCGAIAQMFSAEEPERLRGPQCDLFWADELCAWKKMQETWDMLMFGFRLGKSPRGVISTTPKPVPLLKDIMKGEKDGSTVITKGSTYDNRGNLSDVFYKKVVAPYEGTRLGRQELEAVILDDMPGALWNRSELDRNRIKHNAPPIPSPFLVTNPDTGLIELAVEWEILKKRAADIMAAVGEDLMRCAVAIDPNASNNEGSDEIGITVVGKGVSGRGYLLHDGSMRGSPNEWASSAVLLHDLFKADRIIGEANNGGNMVESTITSAAKFLKIQGLRPTDNVGVTLVHASRGKVTRAEPVSALYEQAKISHVGTPSILEDQMCLFTLDFDRKAMGFSPDRVDSIVWGLTHLFLEASDTGVLEFYQQQHMRQEAAIKAEKDPKNHVTLKAPKGVTQAYGIEGDCYSVDKKGYISVPPKELRGMRQAGFVEVTA